MMIDYITPADRLGTSLAAKRTSAIAYLRARGKYLLDEDCNWTPTCAKATDIRQTIREASGMQFNFRRQAD
jgi:hypothetical protein